MQKNKKRYVLIKDLSFSTVYHEIDSFEECRAEIDNTAIHETHGTPLAVFDFKEMKTAWLLDSITPMGMTSVEQLLDKVFGVKKF